MGQQFKSVYFSDHPAEASARRNLKLAFSAHDDPIAEAVSGLTSVEIRSILGSDSYVALTTNAEREHLALNSYCIRTLREWFSGEESRQGTLPRLGDASRDGTFRAGRVAPLHRWYPFIEAYSPQFVHEIFDRFAPDARRVFDPFAGIGTTPLAASARGLKVYYSEINPLMQFLIDAKVRALSLDTKQRSRTSGDLASLAGDLRERLSACEPDASLDLAFSRTFGSSAFFSEGAYRQVLQARTLIDRLACDDPLVARFATVAALASLVPSSLLRKAGDLRFRTQRELADVRQFAEAWSEQLQLVSQDLAEVESLASTPRLVAQDAKNLQKLPRLEIDTVVTSPPYLNGTNYFRNTKVELWFLRSLRESADLSAFRRAAVTAGINDVTKGKETSEHPSVLKVLERLGDSYDRRIAQMVGSYFADMENVFRGLSTHLRANATVAVDIGDSTYAGTHVPTDALLGEVLAPLGFELEDSVHLRTRMSRDTSPLSQVLMVMRYRGGRPRHVGAGPSAWKVPWSRFKQEVPHQTAPYKSRNWGHPLHSLCSYQGKMKPSLAHHLVKTFLRPGDRMLDPFGGTGTIPFEAALLGAVSYAFEISPAAAIIAGGKLRRARPADIDEVLQRLAEFLEGNAPTERERRNATAIRFNGVLEDYFDPRTFDEIILARRYFLENKPASPAQKLVAACVLHILHGNRPYALSRRSHPITPFAPSGPIEYRALVPRLRAKIQRSIAALGSDVFVDGTVLECDATSWWPQEVDGLNAIITSPPFFDSTRFHLGNWMRLWFTGWERADFDARPRSFVDERQKASFDVYEPVFRQARERLVAGGIVVLHLGKSKKCDMASALGEVAAPWFRVVDRYVENVEHCESHGIRDKGTVTEHQFLVLQ